MLTLFLGTGIRVSECVGLNISDLDFEVNGFMVTRKGGNQAILYFPDEVAEVLKEYLAQRKEIEALPGHTEALFLSLQRKRMTVRAVENMVKKYALLAAPLKRKLSPHKASKHLRHQSVSRNRRHLSGCRRSGAFGRQHHPAPLCRHERRQAPPGGKIRGASRPRKLQ